MALFTITLAPGLGAGEHRRAVRAGPPAVSSRQGTGDLLVRAGFDHLSETDVSGPYLHTARAWIAAEDRYRDGLGCDGATFEQNQRINRATVAAIEAGWLRRHLITARRPI